MHVEPDPVSSLSSTQGSAQAGSLPSRSAAAPITGERASEHIARFRRFCSGDHDAGTDLEKVDSHYLPAVLYPYRSPGAIRGDYPVLLASQDDGATSCTPIAELLPALAESIAPEPGQSRVLKDNLTRLEIEVRGLMSSINAQPKPARDVLEAGARSLEAKLALKGESGKQLHEDLGKLAKALPPESVLLNMTPDAAIQMYLFVARAATQARATALRTSIKALRGRLRDLLALERGKGAQSGEQEKLARAVGGSGQAHVDASALAKLLDRSLQKQTADPARCERIKTVIATFDSFLNEPIAGSTHVIASESLQSLGNEPGVKWMSGGADPCAAAGVVFDELARKYSTLFVSMRTARLELDGAYDPRRHDSLARTFDWRSFSPEELRQLPPVLTIEEPDTLANRNMRSLSRLLLSGRPIDVMVHVSAGTDPGASESEAMARYRMELGYLAVGHREALVNQSTASRPAHLLEGFVRGFGHANAALHVIMSGANSAGRDSVVGAWLFGGAALEARAHPIFHYDPQAGRSWAKRLDFSQNPSPDDDWPKCAVEFTDGDEKTQALSSQFTFADFALLDGAYRGEFRVLPDGLESSCLFEAADYFAMDPHKAIDAIPFAWAADGHGKLRRVAFTQRLGFVCRDRLDFWRTLQELAGVRNEYVRDAVERERERLELAFETERAQTTAKHAAEVETVREQAGGEALQRLAQALVNTDIASLSAGAAQAPIAPKPAAASPSASAATQAAPAEPAPVAAVEEEEPAEPWVDTVLCTSCNDCININAQLFKYNANKQVVIGNPAAGTFLQLVQAAEKCPARCIHPGKPLNPSEPGLEELIERAKPFN